MSFLCDTAWWIDREWELTVFRDLYVEGEPVPYPDGAGLPSVPAQDHNLRQRGLGGTGHLHGGGVPGKGTQQYIKTGPILQPNLSISQIGKKSGITKKNPAFEKNQLKEM